MASGIRCDVCGVFAAKPDEYAGWFALTSLARPEESTATAYSLFSSMSMNYEPPKSAHICSLACLSLVAVRGSLEIQLDSKREW